jgi:hypothetical protein
MKIDGSSPRIWRFTLFAAACSLFAVVQTAAQQPTQAQIGAVRAACRSDYTAYCSSVPPGGKAALACLQKNAASLSAPCQAAVNAIGAGKSVAAPASIAKPAPPEASPGATSTGAAAAPTAAPASGASAGAGAAAVRTSPQMSPRQEMRILRFSCGADYRAICGGVPLGGGRVVACLRANEASLSPQCRQALRGALQR